MPFKINIGLKISTTLLLLTLSALLPGLAPIIVDLAILYAFMITRMLLLSASKAPCFNNANITDFIENKTEQSRLFLLGLPVGIRNKTIKHYKVDELDLNSYAAFDDFVAFAFKTDQSVKTIEAMNREKSLLANFTKDIRTLVKKHTELASVLKSAKKALVIVPFTRKLRFTSEKERIDKSLTQLLDALSNLSLKFDSKTTTKPLLSIPLKMPEVKSASKVKFKLLLSATNHKNEKKKKVKDTRARCKIVASTRTPRTQLKLLINTEMNLGGPLTVGMLSELAKVDMDIPTPATLSLASSALPTTISTEKKKEEDVTRQSELVLTYVSFIAKDSYETDLRAKVSVISKCFIYEHEELRRL
ncbi:hypothetical protein MBM_04536 [Drepanopeziza brunnea f. sp. 'multigermtubi' MB_m1]|uniref:Uncharacterized protein n=1 Tax=Marssonina brunnea f. sp. multigermtubi (strain MB_m1) TaxID=1072389 RepID=K1XW31_MARBU|nr:uncharacterized protein MBM_04536 [Drepanopeziza brunnea f. sp. 'multigermtubi' MB_m1]EKD16959.1 hypothetical protein MBM_04536 [Drepanopeziza brunnea f. sp. 'multigermtubi' MB_m1]